MKSPLKRKKSKHGGDVKGDVKGNGKGESKNDNCGSKNAIALPDKFVRIVKPSRKLYHGRSVTRNTDVWESSDDFRKIMWWALDKVTPLMYASTSIKGRSLDKFYRWDVYESNTVSDMRFLLITKQSILFLMENFSDVRCEGKTLGKWLKKAFPIINGKLYRRSHIDTDRKMAICMCEHVSCVGYIANEIPVSDGPGKLHKEIMICAPSKTLKLKKYMGFVTSRGQDSVEKYLQEKTTTLRPDVIKTY
jgi:hypothetical protein